MCYKFENVGSFSSLTFSDEHIPMVLVLDTDTGNVKHITVSGSVIHKTLTNYKDIILDKLDKEYYNDFKINYRIQIDKSLQVEDRNKIKEYLNKNDNTNLVTFQYKVSSKSTSKLSDNQVSFTKYNLRDQLIKQFEKDTNSVLSVDIKKKILNSTKDIK